MTSLTGYIQGLGNGAKRTIEKQGKEIRLSVYDDIDNVIVFNEAGETSQKHYDGTFNFNQLIHNGNFEDSSYWKIYTASRGTISANNNIGTITYNGSYSGGYDCALAPSGYNIPLTTSHKYLLTVSVKSDFETDIGVEIGTGIGSLNKTLNVGEWTDYSFIAQRPSWSSGTVVLVKPVNSAIVNGSKLQFKNYMFIDLTDMFGSTKADELYAMEQAEAGSGVAWFRSIFNDDYYPYNSGTQTSIPSPLFPEDIKGIGRKQLDGTYSVSIDYDDGDERSGRITASGLAYPLYEGDILDFVNGKVIRANGFLTKAVASMNNSEDYPGWVNSGIRALIGSGKNQNYTNPTVYCNVGNNFSVNTMGQSNDTIFLPKTTYGGLTQSQWIAQYPDLTIAFVFPLATPVEERITLSGDITDIGTATVEADGNLTVKYDKVQMAIRKYSSPPAWDDIGYESTPIEVLNAFDYAEDIKDNWNGVRSFYGDKNLYFFPAVDMTESRGYSGMFQNTNLMHIDPITIGEETPTGNANASSMFRNTFIESASITAVDDSQNFEFSNAFADCINLKSATIEAKASTVVYMFGNCPKLTSVNDTFDTSEITQFNEMFSGCTSLAVVPEIDTSSGTNFYRCFKSCANLKFAPTWDLSKATDLGQMFWDCPNLENVPFYRIPRATNLNGMFQATGNKLTENSRNNILMMCISATAYTGTKTLAQLAFNSSMYSASSWQSLSKYADFVDAGWSIGYT